MKMLFSDSIQGHLRSAARVLSLSVFALAPAARADVNINGSFEQNAASYDPSDLYAPDMSRYGSDTVVGWDFHAVGSPDIVRDADHPQATSGKYNAQDGLFFVHIITYSGYTEGVSTVFNTVAGQEYRTTFAYAQGGLWLDPTNGWKFVGTGDAAMVATVTDTISSSILYSGSHIAPTSTFNVANVPNPFNWLSGSFTFTGDGDPVSLLFSGDRIANSFVNVYLDNVSVVPIPEPGGAWFICLGIATIALGRWKRHVSFRTI